jgi:Uri superfamily endonuclease
LPGRPGTYLLGLRLPKAARLRVGRLGRFHFPAGLYLYAGTALGSGGLAARVGRHLGGARRVHWHVDYLLRQASVETVGWRTGAARLECRWARLIESWAYAIVVAPRFGASDCRCPAHLWRLEDDADAYPALIRMLGLHALCLRSHLD